jgi:hypothetical protein
VGCGFADWYATFLISMLTDLNHPSFIGLPHYIDTDDIYNGNLIPGGSIIIMNLWSVLFYLRSTLTHIALKGV